ncbi:MBL fold metallo-hydrolase [Celerinatantimonas sp. MCCC 1A17872]|uniref:MBL fold metallo-hydrolase n=1 Tax=Celerinatantimonas sp. MCCC 1A17872 TaxID=3177514 RepID=UPI0038CBB0C9
MTVKTEFTLTNTSSLNEPSQVTTGSNLGYCRYSVGDFVVTTISDGSVTFDISQLLLNITSEELDKILKKNALSKNFNMQVNQFLIQTQEKLILVDTGLGRGILPTTGYLIDNLAAAGYQPEQVDALLLTHMHGDHIGGLSVNGIATFPNASLYINEKELNYWLDKTNLANESDANNQRLFEYAPSMIEPYKRSEKLHLFVAGEQIVPGIRSCDSSGHTLGHTSYLVESQGEKLCIIGDIINVGPVQFENVRARMKGFDSDPKSAEKTRIKTFHEVSQDGTLIAATHLDFPGVGYLRQEHDIFVFTPLTNKSDDSVITL